MRVWPATALLVILTACASAQQASQPGATPTIAVIGAAARGKALFQDKGCIMCHVHQRVNNGERAFTMEGTPDLTTYRNDPGFLRRWLADPQAVKPGTRMPNLKLTSDEIESLIAFLNEEQ